MNTVTLAEGDIIPLVGLKGTISALLEVEVALDSGEAATYLHPILSRRPNGDSR